MGFMFWVWNLDDRWSVPRLLHTDGSSVITSLIIWEIRSCIFLIVNFPVSATYTAVFWKDFLFEIYRDPVVTSERWENWAGKCTLCFHYIEWRDWFCPNWSWNVAWFYFSCHQTYYLSPKLSALFQVCPQYWQHRKRCLSVSVITESSELCWCIFTKEW